MKKFILALYALTFTCCFSGCYSLSLDYDASNFQDTVFKEPVSVSVDVTDMRPYILSGNKEPDYIGNYRGGFGNRWQVKTADKLPLADSIKRDLSEELEVIGARVTDDAPKTLQVKIVEYNFDAYINGRFWYKFDLSVEDGTGTAMVHDTLEGEKVILGSFWVGCIQAFKRDFPQIYGQILRDMVRNNDEILNTLRQ